jgi:hypothetical protein
LWIYAGSLQASDTPTAIILCHVSKLTQYPAVNFFAGDGAVLLQFSTVLPAFSASLCFSWARIWWKSPIFTPKIWGGQQNESQSTGCLRRLEASECAQYVGVFGLLTPYPRQSGEVAWQTTLVVIWHVLTEQVADRHAETSAVARKFLRWGKTVGQAHRQGLTIAAFARHHLDRVRVGHDLEAVEIGGKVFKLLPVSSSSA